MFPPSYTASCQARAPGVVTKKHIAAQEQIEKAKKYLHMAGAKTVFVTSSVTGEGMDALMAYLGYRSDAA